MVLKSWRYMSGWPSGLRRQTQVAYFSCEGSKNSGLRKKAWVEIPLLTQSFLLPIFNFILLK
jgi:hypothetical protein